MKLIVDFDCFYMTVEKVFHKIKISKKIGI